MFVIFGFSGFRFVAFPGPTVFGIFGFQVFKFSVFCFTVFRISAFLGFWISGFSNCSGFPVWGFGGFQVFGFPSFTVCAFLNKHISDFWICGFSIVGFSSFQIFRFAVCVFWGLIFVMVFFLKSLQYSVHALYPQGGVLPRLMRN